MKQYFKLVNDTLTYGNVRPDRTGTGTISLFGPQMEFDSRDGLAMLTSKKVYLRKVIEELLFFITGSMDNNDLTKRNVDIWDGWAVRQQDLEYSFEQRVRMYAASPSNDPALAGMFHDAALPDTPPSIVESTAELLDQADVRRLKPNPTEAYVGYLGPIYGAQWRFWRDPEGDTREFYTVGVRFGMAQDMVDAGTNERFTQNQLDHLRRSHDLCEGLNQGVVKNCHSELDNWDVPGWKKHRKTIDQFRELMENLKKRPKSRRHVISAWNVAALPDESKSPQQNAFEGRMCLAPCHTIFQFYVEERPVADMLQDLHEKWISHEENRGFIFNPPQWIVDYERSITIRSPEDVEAAFDFVQRNRVYAYFDDRGIKTQMLHCKLYQRSADICVGVPFNIPSYQILNAMIAQCCGYVPGKFIHTFGDAHIYKNHLLPNEHGDSIFTQLDREPRALPTLKLNPDIRRLEDFALKDIEVVGYNPHDPIKYAVAI